MQHQADGPAARGGGRRRAAAAVVGAVKETHHTFNENHPARARAPRAVGQNVADKRGLHRPRVKVPRVRAARDTVQRRINVVGTRLRRDGADAVRDEGAQESES